MLIIINKFVCSEKKNNEEIYLKNVDSMITKKSTKAEDSLKNLNQ